MQVFRTASTENEAVMPKAPSRTLNKPSTKDVRRSGNYKYRIDELNDPPVRHPGIRSLLPLPGGDLLTGGTDLKIRYWDQARFSFICASLASLFLFPSPPDIIMSFYICQYWRPEQSFCIAGPSAKEVRSAKGDILEKAVGNDECYDIRSSFGVQVVQVTLVPCWVFLSCSSAIHVSQ